MCARTGRKGSYVLASGYRVEYPERLLGRHAVGQVTGQPPGMGLPGECLRGRREPQQSDHAFIYRGPKGGAEPSASRPPECGDVATIYRVSHSSPDAQEPVNRDAQPLAFLLA